MQQYINIKTILFLFFTFIMFIFVLNIWSDSLDLKESITADLHEIKFKKYLIRFNKSYSGVEYKRRLQNFKTNLAEISRLNKLENATVFGLTQFSDMSAEEFADQKLMKLGLRGCINRDTYCDSAYLSNKTILPSIQRPWNNETLPLKVDWREKGYVSPVSDQKQCGACWAFAVIGAMETMAAKAVILSGKFALVASYDTLGTEWGGDNGILDPSPQELIDCSSYNNKCRGGRIATALQYICYNKLGIVPEKKYPLTLKDNSDCRTPSGNAVTVKRFRYHCDMKEDDILRLIAFHGPVTTVVTSPPWANYIGGIIWRACIRNEESIKHAVQIVGYDKTGAIPYYIIKNSWGTDFGDNGYVKVKMYGNICGVAEEIGEIHVMKMKNKKSVEQMQHDTDRHIDINY